METKVKTTVYAKKLREHRAKLMKERAVELKKYETALAGWRTALVRWTQDNAAERVRRINRTELKNCERSNYHDRPGFDTGMFFYGAPKPPKFPSDQQIRDIANVLRHLGITGQTDVRVSTSDVAKLMGEGKYEED